VQPAAHRSRISSTANPRLRGALRLRGRRERDRHGLTLVDGVRETARALAGGASLREVFVSTQFCNDDECRALLDQLTAAEVPLWELGPDAFARLAYGDRLDGVIAVAEMPRHSLADLPLPADPLLAVIEGVEKPGNLGAVLRTADGAGVSAVIVAESGTDLFNPNVIRASLGTIFSVPVAVASTGDVLAWLGERGIRIVAARVQASIDYTTADYRGAVAIALGSEARGLSDAWAELADISVHVPMLGIADSLNVSATAAVIFYEALRQRRTDQPKPVRA
jgi:TrmH family RNA methyltransferase